MDIKRYLLGNNVVEYIFHDESHVVLSIFPKSVENLIKRPWELEKMPFNPRAKYTRSVFPGNLAYCTLKGDNLELPGYTMKNIHDLESEMKFKSQILEENDNDVTRLSGVKVL